MLSIEIKLNHYGTHQMHTVWQIAASNFTKSIAFALNGLLACLLTC